MRTIFLVLLLVACSCNIKEMSVMSSSAEDGIWVSTEIPSGSADGRSCVVTAFSYPESFDWYNGDVTCVKSSLIAFCDGAPVVKLAVGEGYRVSHEPDRHRFIDGHLYTDCPVDGDMVLSRDGRQIVRYKGEERLVGMVLENEHVYTLGIPSGGEGFFYRRDGESLIGKHAGTVFRHLKKDGDKISFAYRTRRLTEDGEKDIYYIVRDGVEKRLELPEAIDEALDIISHDGETCAVVRSSYSGEAYYYREGSIKLLDIPSSSRLISASFIGGDFQLPCMEGVYENADGSQTCAIWIEENEYLSIENRLAVSYACSSADRIGFVMNQVSEGSNGFIMAGSQVSTMPDGYRCIGARPVAMDGIEMYVGLSSTQRRRPLLWRGGSIDTLDINGYISSVTLTGN